MSKKTDKLVEQLKQAARDLESRTDDLLATRETETKIITDLLAQAERKKAESEKTMEDSIQSGDFDAYRPASESYKGACSEIDFQTSRLKALDKKPLISRGEYESEVTTIFTAFMEVNNAVKEVLRTLSDEMEAEGAALSGAIDAANAALTRWQQNAYKRKDNEPVVGSAKIKDYETVLWSMKGVEAPQYKEYKKETE